MFEDLVPQEKVWTRLLAARRNGRVAGAYLFHGPPGSGKEGIALRYCALLNCHRPDDEPCGTCPSCTKFRSLQHPNVILLVPFPRDRDIVKEDPPLKALSHKTLALLNELTQRKAQDPYAKITLPRASTILLNSVRDLRKKIYLKAVETGRKFVLIFDAHLLMTQQGESANALLKIIEEPPESTTFILTTETPDRLTETIRSRCQSVYFPPLLEEALLPYLTDRMDVDDSRARFLAHLSQGNVRLARSLAKENLDDLDSLVDRLVTWLTQDTGEGYLRFVTHALSSYRADPQALALHFQLLSYFFRDAYLVQTLNGEAGLILLSLEDTVRKICTRFPQADFPGVVSALELCMDSLSRNYHPNLVFMNLLLDIRENLRPEGPVRP
ncbi:MAG: ATP-binding protein [Fidelibacterota bacterium]